MAGCKSRRELLRRMWVRGARMAGYLTTAPRFIMPSYSLVLVFGRYVFALFTK